MKSYQQLFAELKRRRVFKVTSVYGAVAFALIQVADPLTKALLLPDAFLTYVAAILLLGFPLALVLAWAFETTPEGVRKTEPATPGEIAAYRGGAGCEALVRGAARPARCSSPRRRRLVGRTPERCGGRGRRRRCPRRAPGLHLPRRRSPAVDRRPAVRRHEPQGDQEYFSDGMTEELLNTLARIQELRVAARTSTFAFKGDRI